MLRGLNLMEEVFEGLSETDKIVASDFEGNSRHESSI